MLKTTLGCGSVRSGKERKEGSEGGREEGRKEGRKEGGKKIVWCILAL